MQKKKKALMVLGPTATGKTHMAVGLARYFSGEIISADSRQVYRGLDIGTGKDLSEYSEGGAAVRTHLLDVCDPNDSFDLHAFCRMTIDAEKEIYKRGNIPVVAGGTMLYLDALLKQYELHGSGRDDSTESLYTDCSDAELSEKLKEKSPELFAKTDTSERRRLLRALELAGQSSNATVAYEDVEYLLLAPYYHRKTVHERIALRLRQRWSGLVEETKVLKKQGVSDERLDWFGLEYRYMAWYLSGKLTEKEAFDQLLIKIRQFAKRQDIWCRKLEREGASIYWVEDGDLPSAIALAESFLKGEELPEPKIRLMDIIYGPKSQ